MKKFDFTPFKEQVEDKPLLVAGILSALIPGTISAVAQLMRANTERKNSKTWKKEVDRRTANQNRPRRR